MGVQAVEKEIQKDKQSSGNMSQEEINNKEKWVKLTGPAAESLAEAFFGPAAVVLQEIMGVSEDAEEVTGGTNNAMKREECILNRDIKETIQIPSGEGAEERGPQVTGKDTTAEDKPVSVSPTKIFMAGRAGAKKNIKVLKSYRIVLLGNTRTGKSSLANTIFGEDVFKINQSPISGTSDCQAESKSVHGRRITLTDTPGFCDTERPEEEMKCEIVRWITECAPGPHVFLIVLKVKQDQDIITKICQYIPDEIFKYAAVVFTHGEQLPEGMKIEEFVEQNKCLRDLVKKCSSRCHVVDNEYWKYNEQSDYRSNQFQVADLLNTIDKIVIENKRGCYTNKMLHAGKREPQEKSNMTSKGNVPQGHTSNTAMNSVSRNVWLKLTGPVAESLAEAFFGPTVVVWQEEQQKGAAEEIEAAAEDDEATGVDQKASKKLNEKKDNEEGDTKEEGKTKEEKKEVHREDATEKDAAKVIKEEDKKTAIETKKRKVVENAKKVKPATGGGFGNFISNVFGALLSIGASLLGVGSAFAAMLPAAAVWLQSIVGPLGVTAGAGGASVPRTAGAGGASPAGTAGAGGASVARIAGYIVRLLGITAGAGILITGVVWIVKKIQAICKWVVQIFNKCKEFFNDLKQHSRIILLVIVFYSLLLLSFYVQEPIAETLLLMFGVLFWLLLTVD